MSTLIELAVKGTLLLCCAGITVTLMRRATASARHLIWMSAFCAIGLLPVARMSLPEWRVPVLPAPLSAIQPAFTSEQATPWLPAAPSRRITPPLVERAARPAGPAVPASSDTSPFEAGEIAVVAWLMGALILAARSGRAWILLRRTVQRAKSGSATAAQAHLQRAIAHFRVRRPITLLITEGGELPCTFGIRRPVILLPDSVLGDRSRLDTVLAHEMAHIARFDALAEMLIRVVIITQWFNPLAWIAARLARFERERAADDAVLTSGARPSAYAADLVSIASARQSSSWTSAVPMATSSFLERRVRAILDGTVRRGRHSRTSLAAALVLPAVMFPIAAAQLVAQAPISLLIERTRLSASALPSASETLPGLSLMSVTPSRMSAAIVVAETAPQSPPQPSPQPPSSADKWQAERLTMLEEILKRAQAFHKDALTRIQIGTTAPIDIDVLETALAQIEQQVNTQRKVVTESKLAGHTQASWLQESAKIKFSGAMSNLDAVAIRFANGLASTKDVVSALGAATGAVAPDFMKASHSFLFVAGADPLSSPNTQGTSPYSWQRVNSDADVLAAIRATVKISSEAGRADELIALAQSFAFTAEMASAWVDAAKSIKDEKVRARVFAQSVRLKGSLD